MKIISLDTEYEICPRRLISIAYIITDNNEIIEKKDILIKHDTEILQIDENGVAFSKHKITNKMCQEKGLDIENVLTIFNDDLDKIDYIIGHNIITADISTIRREAIGVEMWDNIWKKLKTKKIYDTIKESKKNIPEMKSYSLDKVYQKIFHKEFVNHHNALEDCKTTFEIFQHFKKENGQDNLSIIQMNFPEDDITNSLNTKFCSHCNKNIKNYYVIQNINFKDKYDKYTFKPYSQYGLENGKKLCSKCYENIEIIKYFNSKMVDIFNKNMNKNTFKYTSEFLETKKFCFQYIENTKKVNKIYLNCPFEQKELCKQKGGRWDQTNKKWYITEDKNKNEFTEWLN